MSLDPRAPVTRTAELSPCGRFRFRLSRTWSEHWPVCAWLMLNPSTADAERDDPTMLRLMAWARAWNYGGVEVVNVFPYRASKPSALWGWLRGARGFDTEGRDEAIEANLWHIADISKNAALRLVGFGAEAAKRHPDHVRAALAAFREGTFCLGNNSLGWPLHPMARGKMRIPDRARPVFWTWPGAGQ